MRRRVGISAAAAASSQMHNMANMGKILPKGWGSVVVRGGGDAVVN